MKTKITMLNGDEHVLDGHPQEIMKMVGGLGVGNKSTLEVSTGETVNMADIVIFQQVAE